MDDELMFASPAPQSESFSRREMDHTSKRFSFAHSILNSRVVCNFFPANDRQTLKEMLLLPCDVSSGAKIGQGSYGVVHRGFFRQTQPVALKIMHGPSHSNNETHEKILIATLYEALMLNQMKDAANIVSAYGIVIEPATGNQSSSPSYQNSETTPNMVPAQCTTSYSISHHSFTPPYSSPHVSPRVSATTTPLNASLSLGLNSSPSHVISSSGCIPPLRLTIVSTLCDGGQLRSIFCSSSTASSHQHHQHTHNTSMSHMSAGVHSVSSSPISSIRSLSVNAHNNNNNNYSSSHHQNNQNLQQIAASPSASPSVSLLFSPAAGGLINTSGISLNTLQRLKIAEDLFRGLAFMHAHKTCHRDITSGNALFMSPITSKFDVPHVLLADLGLASSPLYPPHPDIPLPMPSGTVASRAPEFLIPYLSNSSTELLVSRPGFANFRANWKTESLQPSRSDVYSAGLLVVEILTGVETGRALGVSYSNFEEWADAVVIQGKRPSTSSIAANYSETLASILKSCMHPLPLERPSASKVLSVIEETLKTHLKNNLLVSINFLKNTLGAAGVSSSGAVPCSTLGSSSQLMSVSPPLFVEVDELFLCSSSAQQQNNNHHHNSNNNTFSHNMMPASSHNICSKDVCSIPLPHVVSAMSANLRSLPGLPSVFVSPQWVVHCLSTPQHPETAQHSSERPAVSPAASTRSLDDITSSITLNQSNKLNCNDPVIIDLCRQVLPLMQSMHQHIFATNSALRQQQQSGAVQISSSPKFAAPSGMESSTVTPPSPSTSAPNVRSGFAAMVLDASASSHHNASGGLHSHHAADKYEASTPPPTNRSYANNIQTRSATNNANAASSVGISANSPISTPTRFSGRNFAAAVSSQQNNEQHSSGCGFAGLVASSQQNSSNTNRIHNAQSSSGRSHLRHAIEDAEEDELLFATPAVMQMNTGGLENNTPSNNAFQTHHSSHHNHQLLFSPVATKEAIGNYSRGVSPLPPSLSANVTPPRTTGAQSSSLANSAERGGLLSSLIRNQSAGTANNGAIAPSGHLNSNNYYQHQLQMHASSATIGSASVNNNNNYTTTTNNNNLISAHSASSQSSSSSSPLPHRNNSFVVENPNNSQNISSDQRNFSGYSHTSNVNYSSSPLKNFVTSPSTPIVQKNAIMNSHLQQSQSHHQSISSQSVLLQQQTSLASNVYSNNSQIHISNNHHQSSNGHHQNALPPTSAHVSSPYELNNSQDSSRNGTVSSSLPANFFRKGSKNSSEVQFRGPENGDTQEEDDAPHFGV